MQIAGQTAGRAYHHIFRTRHLVHKPDDFTLTRQRPVAKVIEPLHFFFPFGSIVLNARRVGRVHAIVSDSDSELFQCDARVGDERQGGMLERIKRRNVDADEPDTRVLERRFGGGGKIAQARADGNNQVCFAGSDVRARCACHPNCTEVLRMIIVQ